MKKTRNIIIITLLAIILLSGLNTNSQAASATINAPSTATVGETITISVSGTGVQWNLSLLVNGTEIAKSSELENYESNKNISLQGTYTPTNEGELSITLTGSVTEFSDGSTLTDKDFSSKKVTVNAKKEEPKQETPATTETETKTEETPKEEPKQEISFAVASGTVYTTTSDLNFRSTSDGSVIGSIDKAGTELKVTGVGEDKTRVEYNGKEGYVASKYVTSEKPEVKSDNANLKSLTVGKYELSPKFSKDTTKYTLTVPNDVDKLDVKAETEDSKAKVDIKGNDSLKEKESTIAVSVSAEDGTIKIYEIKVTKEDAKTTLGLKSLKIKDTNIDKLFKTDTYIYKIDIPSVDKLEIEAIATDEKAKVEIEGNKELKDGENQIKIIVTSEDGQKKVTYQIKATRGAVAAKTEEKSSGISPKVYLFGAIGLVVVAAIVVGVIIFIKRRKRDEMEFSDNIEENNNNEFDLDRKPKIDYYMDNKENNVENNIESNVENNVESGIENNTENNIENNLANIFGNNFGKDVNNLPESNISNDVKIEKIEDEINNYINNANDDDFNNKKGRHF